MRPDCASSAVAGLGDGALVGRMAGLRGLRSEVVGQAEALFGLFGLGPVGGCLIWPVAPQAVEAVGLASCHDCFVL